jgi:hypothetical protein
VIVSPGVIFVRLAVSGHSTRAPATLSRLAGRPSGDA